MYSELFFLSSDSSHFQLHFLLQIKQVKRARLSTSLVGKYHPSHSPWTLPFPDLKDVDFAFPCATQNEIDKDSAMLLLEKGCKGVFEGANLPVNAEGQDIFRSRGLLYIPGKAANAGGVGTSGLEMSQNASM